MTIDVLRTPGRRGVVAGAPSRGDIIAAMRNQCPRGRTRGASVLCAFLAAACAPDRHAQRPDGSEPAVLGGLKDVEWEVVERIPSLVEVTWWQDEEATAYVVGSFDDVQRTTTPFLAAAGQNRQILPGIPFDQDFTLEVVNELLDGTQVRSPPVPAATGSAPAGLPEVTVHESLPDLQAPDTEFLFAVIFGDHLDRAEPWKFIIDRSGRMVWAHPSPLGTLTSYVRTARSGRDLLWDQIDFTEGGDLVNRMKLDGQVVELYDTPGLHHAYTELDDESVYWGAIDEEMLEDERLMRTMPGEGAEVIWDCAEFMAAYDTTLGCASNAVSYDAASDSLLYSFFTTMTVVQIGLQTGDTMLSWGQLSDWTFDPPSSAFYWQHGVTMTEQGTLLLSTHVSETSNEGVVREYQIDRENRVLREIWNMDVGRGIESERYGEARRLANGNTLHNFGSTAQVTEGTPDGTIAWDVSFEMDEEAGGATLGRSVFIADLNAYLP